MTLDTHINLKLRFSIVALCVALALTGMLFGTQYILLGKQRSFNERDSLNFYELIWQEALKRHRVLMEQNITALTRDRVLTKNISRRDRDSILENIKVSQNRLEALGILQSISIFDIEENLLADTNSAANPIIAASLLKTVRKNNALSAGLLRSKDGTLQFGLGFPVFERGKQNGYALFTLPLSKVVEEFTESSTLSGALSNTVSNSLTYISNESLTSLAGEYLSQPYREGQLGEHTYQLITLPLKNSFDELLGHVSFIRDITAQTLERSRTYNMVAAGFLVFLIFFLAILYRFVVTVGQRLINLEQAKNEELARANLMMHEASQAKSNFMASMSHELRTPLNGIVSLAKLLELSDLDEEQAEDVRTLIDCSETLKNIINSVLDYSKIAAGMMTLDCVEFSPLKLFERVLKKFSGLAREKDVIILGEFSPKIPERCMGDPLKLEQILNNLVSNALKFTKTAGGVIVILDVVSQTESEIHLVLNVIDTGKGIPEDKWETVFQSFEQADNTITREFGGTGLGLALVREFVELMGGDIALNSKVGVGTVFTLRFPLGLKMAESEETEVLESGISVESRC